ncbi:hypothetical protein EDB84DRAFT_1439997 [Lactarius hengduanensis]|nr:hypothetical protein EDB84DRAFT_1439997 [Lactarius hengduanensis]
MVPNHATATSTPRKPIPTQSPQDCALMRAASDEDDGGAMHAPTYLYKTPLTAPMAAATMEGNVDDDSGDKDTSKAASLMMQRRRGGVRWQGRWQRQCDDSDGDKDDDDKMM